MLNPHSGHSPGPDGADHVGAVLDRSPAPPAAAAARRTRATFTPGVVVRGLAWDIGLPLVVFYGLHLARVGDWNALLGATLATAARIGWVAVRNRTLNPFAIVMLGTFALGLALAFVSGEPRYLLLKSSIVTASVGIMFLVSVVGGHRPLTLAAEQHWAPSRAVEIAEEYRTEPDVRHGHRVSSLVWGLGLLSEAIARIPLVFLVPISFMVGLSSAMLLATIGGLIVWTVRYGRAAAQRADGAAGAPR